MKYLVVYIYGIQFTTECTSLANRILFLFVSLNVPTSSELGLYILFLKYILTINQPAGYFVTPTNTKGKKPFESCNYEEKETSRRRAATFISRARRAQFFPPCARQAKMTGWTRRWTCTSTASALSSSWRRASTPSSARSSPSTTRKRPSTPSFRCRRVAICKRRSSTANQAFPGIEFVFLMQKLCWASSTGMPFGGKKNETVERDLWYAENWRGC